MGSKILLPEGSCSRAGGKIGEKFPWLGEQERVDIPVLGGTSIVFADELCYNWDSVEVNCGSGIVTRTTRSIYDHGETARAIAGGR